jgi:hypothetical protein
MSANNKQTTWPESTSKLYRPSDSRFSAKLLLTFADRGCYVVSVTDPYGRILGFLDRSLYFFFQVAPQLYSRGWVDPAPDPLLLRKCGSAGNRTRISGSVARNSDHYTTEVVYFLRHKKLKNWTPWSESASELRVYRPSDRRCLLRHNIYKFSSYLTGNTIHLRCVARNCDH